VSETWYKVCRYSDNIEAVNVERYTDSSVWINANRRARKGDYDSFYPSWGDAHEAMLKTVNQTLRNSQLSLDRAEKQYAKVSAMRPPVVS
jgi:hypothetical protein